MPVVTRSQSKMLNKLRETANSNVITRNQSNELKQLRQNINTPIHKKCARKTVCNPIIPEVKSNKSKLADPNELNEKLRELMDFSILNFKNDIENIESQTCKLQFFIIIISTSTLMN